MRICMQRLSITEFKENYSNDCTDYWYNSKYLHLNLQKRTKYEDRKATKKQQPNFKISGLESQKATIQQTMDLVTKKIDFFAFGDFILVYSSVVLHNVKFLSFL